MTQERDGEFELVLGNRQLLSVFFIVVVLLRRVLHDGLHGRAELGRRRLQPRRPASRRGGPRPGAARPQPPPMPRRQRRRERRAGGQHRRAESEPAETQARRDRAGHAAGTSPSDARPPPRQAAARRSCRQRRWPQTRSIPAAGETRICRWSAVQQPRGRRSGRSLRKKGFPALLARAPKAGPVSRAGGAVRPTAARWTSAQGRPRERGFQNPIVRK